MNQVLMLVAYVSLVFALPMAAQDLYCNGDTCIASVPGGDIITCRSYPSGEMACSNSSTDAGFQAWRESMIDQYQKPGMARKEAESAFEAAMNKEPESVLAARRELCNKGILKPDRCDFSAAHPLGYKVPPPPPYSEGTPEELEAAIKEGKASKCIINISTNDADVYLDGVKIGVSPLPLLTLKKRDAPRKLLVRMPGYTDKEIKIDPDGSLKVLGAVLEPEHPTIAKH
jgi:hypothetical protein